MPSITQTGASGVGSLALGVSVGVSEVYSVATAFGDDTQLSPLPEPRRVWHFGWYALGYAAAGADPAFVSWSQYQTYTADDPRTQDPDILTFADTLFWALDPGCTADITVYWR